jgi:DNA modification methylase
VNDEHEAVLWPAGVGRADDQIAGGSAQARAPAGTSYFLSPREGERDAVTWLRTLPDESIDLVVTDPPYESLEKHRAVGTTTRLSHSKSSSNDWFTVFPNARFPELFAEVFRVLKKNAHFYLYCDQETAFIAKPGGEAAGFKFWKPLVWDKCLAPETLVCTGRGVVPIGELSTSDHVFTPDGRQVAVLATRRARSSALRLTLSDGTSIVCSEEHIFVDDAGTEIEAKRLQPGSRLQTSAIRDEVRHGRSVIAIDAVGETDLVDIAIDDDRQLYVLGNGLVTHNCAIGMGYHYRSRYELILFFEKGKRKLNDLGIADVIREKRIHRGYPTEKPIAVSRVLIEQSSQPGELVIDPFMGTASAGVAAVLGGRSFAGSDISDKSLVIAEERLSATGATKWVAPPWTPRDVATMAPAQLALGLPAGEEE